jgi:hypothetical protein
MVPIVWTALAACAVAAWRATLPLTGRFLVQRREQVLSVVCGEAGI